MGGEAPGGDQPLPDLLDQIVAPGVNVADDSTWGNLVTDLGLDHESGSGVDLALFAETPGAEFEHRKPNLEGVDGGYEAAA